jgi:hypothetical protein
VRRAWLILCLAAVGCTLGPPHDAQGYARRLQSLVGRQFGPVTVRSLEAEDNVLVVTFDGPANWRQGMPSYVLTAYFMEGFCTRKEAAGYFAEGRSMRLVTLEEGGSRIAGPPVTRCPTATGL